MAFRLSRAEWLGGVSALGCLSLLGAAGAAQAQVTPPSREELTRPTTTVSADAGPRLTIDGGIERAPCPLDGPEFQSIRLTLDQVVFDGLQGLDAADMQPAWADLAGQNLALPALCDIRDRANAILADEGYIATVEVPEQRIEGGTVHLRVVMARLTEVRLNGDAGRAETLIAAYLRPLTERPVFNRFEAERALLLASDVPGYSVRLALRPAGTVRGDVIGEVTIQRRGAEATLTAQNLGSPEVGPWGLLAQGQWYGLTGMGDRTSLAVFSTPDFEEQRTVQLAHDVRLGSGGLSLGGQVTWSQGRPDLDIPGFDIRSETLFATVEASYPFVRRQSHTLRGAIGLDVVDQDITFNDIGLSEDHLRVAYARMDYARISDPFDGFGPNAPRWRVSARLEARKGLDAFGASDDCGPGLVDCFAPGVTPPSRLEGDPTAFVLRGEAGGEYRFSPALALAVEARAQHADAPLFSFEEFSVGNYTIGRGYDPAAIQGDNGAAIRAELRVGQAVPTSRTDWAFEAFAFVDQAWTSDNDELFIIPDAELTSLGGGLRAAWGDRLRIEAMIAVPMDALPLETAADDPRLLITLSTRLWPWSFR